MSDSASTYRQRGLVCDDPEFGWEWNADGMLALFQDQVGSPYRTGDSKKPTLVFHAEQLPELVAAIKQAAAEFAPDIEDDIRHSQKLIAKLRALAADTLPSPALPAKKKGAAP